MNINDVGYLQVELLRASEQFASFCVVMAVKEVLVTAFSAWNLVCA